MPTPSSIPQSHKQSREPAYTTIAKKELRAQTRTRRANLSAQQRSERDANIQHHLLDVVKQLPAGSTVTAFCPSSTEPGGADLPVVLSTAGMKVLLPRVIPNSPTPTMEWVYYTGTLQAGPWGLTEPAGSAEPHAADHVALFVIPALGVDMYGYRLGQGGGFYDRQLAQNRQSTLICAIVDSEDIHHAVPHADHDIPVDIIISDCGQHNVKNRL